MSDRRTVDTTSQPSTEQRLTTAIGDGSWTKRSKTDQFEALYGRFAVYFEPLSVVDRSVITAAHDRVHMGTKTIRLDDEAYERIAEIGRASCRERVFRAV